MLKTKASLPRKLNRMSYVFREPEPLVLWEPYSQKPGNRSGLTARAVPARKPYVPAPERAQGVALNQRDAEPFMKDWFPSTRRSHWAETASVGHDSVVLPKGGYVSPSGFSIASSPVLTDDVRLQEGERQRLLSDGMVIDNHRRFRFVGPFRQVPSIRDGVLGQDCGLVYRHVEPIWFNEARTVRENGYSRIECGDISRVKNSQEHTKAFIASRYAALYEPAYGSAGPRVSPVRTALAHPVSVHAPYEVRERPTVRPRLLKWRKEATNAARDAKRIGSVAFKAARQFHGFSVVNAGLTGLAFAASQVDADGNLKRSVRQAYFSCEGGRPMELWYLDNQVQPEDLRGESYFSAEGGSFFRPTGWMVSAATGLNVAITDNLGSVLHQHRYDWMVESSNLHLVANSPRDYSYWSARKAASIEDAERVITSPSLGMEAFVSADAEARWTKKRYDFARAAPSRIGVLRSSDAALLERIRAFAKAANTVRRKATSFGYLKFVGAARGSVWSPAYREGLKVSDDGLIAEEPSQPKPRRRYDDARPVEDLFSPEAPLEALFW